MNPKYDAGTTERKPKRESDENEARKERRVI
jgi:hypothetical protein